MLPLSHSPLLLPLQTGKAQVFSSQGADTAALTAALKAAIDAK